MSIRKIPDAIWLQWPKDRNVDRDTVGWADVTWAENAIEDTDPKYLRSTPAREAAGELLAFADETLASTQCTCKFLGFVGREPPCDRCQLEALVAKAGGRS